MTCTFFGHRDAPIVIKTQLKKVLTDLIENREMCNFYIGNHGSFDSMVLNVLTELKQTYTHINFAVVLAYLTDEKEGCDSVYPEGLECVPPRFAISARNKWMIEKSDCVITYVSRNFGGAAQFKELAEKKGKTVINLA